MLTLILFLAITIGLVYTFISVIITFFESYKSIPNTLRDNLPAVSILKPLKGTDDQLEKNLESFFKLNWPKYEILFGFNNIDDPAIEIVKNLQRKFPHIESKLIIDTTRIGLNPKINNLYNIFDNANYDYLLISDSNISVQPSYLNEIMNLMSQTNVGLVTSTFRGISAKSIGSTLENLHLNSFIAGNIFTINKLFNIPITIGKSMLIKKKIINKLNGFSSYANYLAEDHLLGLHIRKMGLEIRHSTYIIDNINEQWSINRFMNRHLRWAKMRKSLNIFHYAFEILANPIFLAIPYTIIRSDGLGIIHLAIIILLKTLLDKMIATMIKSDLKWYHYLLNPFKDLLIGIIWLVPFVDNKVNWRGNLFRIKRGTRLLPLT